MNSNDLARKLVFGEQIEDKLFDFKVSDIDINPEQTLIVPPVAPGRCESLKIQDIRTKFPSPQSLKVDQKKAYALHFFANHELLAIEMMATALLLYPSEDKVFKRGLLATIKDEQKHLNLYISRMKELETDFGDYPLNGFFWSYFPSLKTKENFIAMMSLTFEAANLDFAIYYRDLFKGFGDFKTAEILQVVLEDEISHVAFGRNCFQAWKKDIDLWDYYLTNLPWPLTPSRSKGPVFQEDPRFRAGLDKSFCHKIKNYQDEFRVTNRKTWKKN